jgi:hypothetical protein
MPVLRFARSGRMPVLHIKAALLPGPLCQIRQDAGAPFCQIWQDAGVPCRGYCIIEEVAASTTYLAKSSFFPIETLKNSNSSISRWLLQMPTL